ncbi:uncharacterized protein V6R79_007252 [Siganus canaliculatus]
MEQQPMVEFRNVGQLYFPQTKVECHYSLTPAHQWSSSDWIGIFEVGWTSVKRYYTYTWALVPDGYIEGSNANCCVVFHASYLPCPSEVEYEFVYVDKKGQVCSRSRPFIFNVPKPLEELETLNEEHEEEEGEDELLLVIPRAQLLQSRLDKCLKKQAEIQQALDMAKKEIEDEREVNEKAKIEWEREREAMKEEILELRDNMRENDEMLRKIEGKHKDVKYSQENLTCELSKLMTEKTESQQRIKDLEEDIRILNNRDRDGNMELERLRERIKKMSRQMRYDEEKRKSLLEESEGALSEVHGLQERLEASEHIAETMRRELRELGTRQSHTHTELHQARLQVAQLTLQLSEENLLLREERANWALEREAYKHAGEGDKKKIQELSCELQRKDEWLQEERMEREKLEAELGSERECSREQLSDAKRELQELKADLKTAQKEGEEQQEERKDLISYIHKLEQRLHLEPEINGETSSCAAPASSSDEDGHVSSAPPRFVRSPLFFSNHLERPHEVETSHDTHFQKTEEQEASDTQ